MPRQARLDIPGALHHIMVRGINKTDIFIDDEDRMKFLERLDKNVSDAKCSVYAWVIMNNHVHILFKSGEKSISTVMRRLLTWYAIYFNRKHNRTGHLFENRYKSVLCDEEKYLFCLIKYIHLNPLRSGMVKDIEELVKYKWSGHIALMGNSEQKIMDTKYVLALFSKNRQKAINAYENFIKEKSKEEDDKQNFSGGGLIKSSGGWSQVISMRRKKIEAEFDERILGSGEFVHNILKESEEKEKRQLKFRNLGKTIDSIIKEECVKREININELKSGSRRKKVSVLRLEAAIRCKEEIGASNAEIARNLGVNTSSVTRLLMKNEK